MIAVAVNSLLCDAMRNFVAGVIGRFRVDVGKTEALRPDQFLIVHHADGNARQAAIRDLSANPAVEEPLGAFDVGMIADSSVQANGERKRERRNSVLRRIVSSRDSVHYIAPLVRGSALSKIET